MDKAKLVAHITLLLQDRVQVALRAVEQAHDTATHEENVAENKYDTLGLEAAYLAHGQSERVDAYMLELKQFEDLPIKQFTENDRIAFGAYVELEDGEAQPLKLFVSPCAGGLKFNFEGVDYTLVTPAAPLGKQLIDKELDDEFHLNVGGSKKSYTIVKLL